MPHALTTTGTAVRRSPRAQRPPSDRDLEIYVRVKIKGFEQWEVAQDQKLHYSRVSQIVKRVARWLAAGGCPANPLLRDHAARQRLANANLKLRLTRAIELATICLELPNNVETTRRRVQGLTEVWREETTKSAPRLDLTALRTLIDATQALQKLEEADEARGAPQPMSDEDLLRAVFDILCGLRARAEAHCALPPASDIRAAVAAALASLLGQSVAEICPIALAPPGASVGLPSSEPPAPQRPPEPAEAIPPAQPPLPSAQPPLPSAQVTFPSAQEPLKLSPPPMATFDTTTDQPPTSSSRPAPSSRPLEPFPPPLPPLPSSDILNT
jgi:hypothetical protein